MCVLGVVSNRDLKDPKLDDWENIGCNHWLAIMVRHRIKWTSRVSWIWCPDNTSSWVQTSRLIYVITQGHRVIRPWEYAVVKGFGRINKEDDIAPKTLLFWDCMRLKVNLIGSGLSYSKFSRQLVTGGKNQLARRSTKTLVDPKTTATKEMRCPNLRDGWRWR